MLSASAAHFNKVENLRNSYDTVFTDCDAVLWHDDNVIDGSPEVINKLKAIGKRVFFITNNGTKTRKEIWSRAKRLGYEIDETDIIAPSHSIAEYLKRNNFNKKVYVIGSDAISRELSAVGIESSGSGPDPLNSTVTDYIQNEIVTQNTDEIGAVVVGFDEHFSYAKMMKASNILCTNTSCLFLTTNVDPVHRYPKFSMPGTGAMLKAIETCVGHNAIEFGKPNPLICTHLIEDGVVVPERTLMIGDCYKIDVKFGKNCGFQTLLVGTGSYKLPDVREMLTKSDNASIPDYYLSKLGDLLPYL